jgi:glucokinase
MTLLLAGDIGGTKTILSLVEAHFKTGQSQPVLKTRFEARYSSHEFFDLVPMVQTFLAAASQDLGITPQPEKACFAIAGPVVDDTSQLTNLSWLLNARRLEQDLAIPHIALINDFEAVGYGVLGLEPPDSSDLMTLQAGEPRLDAPIAVIGAGTGLGEGFLIRQGEDYCVYPTEGGHTDFSPRTDLEFQLLKYLQDKYGLQRVSVERVVSGQGIVAIYQFLRDSLGCDHPSGCDATPVGQMIRTWEQQAGQDEKTVDPAAAIATAALENSDYLSTKTMQLFMEAYGAEAGNLALKLLPFGGVYIAGGVVVKNLPLILEGSFLQAFHAKGRMRPLMEKIPIWIILNARVGLLGAALRASKL